MSDLSGFLNEAQTLLPDAIALRRRIHANPELGLDLPETTQAVLDSIKDLGLEIARGPSSSGVVALLRGGKSRGGRTILLRGDMDALPLGEDTGLEFASQVAGRMHACGHDAHTSMLVQAARLLHRHRAELSGNVKFMFQPGEEGFAGALRMIEDGIVESEPKPDAAFALHISPNFKADIIVGRPGPMMASADRWSIIVKGRGGHASAPQMAVDPIPVACEIVQALQTMVTRRIDAFDPVVLTCGQISAGTTNNIIPETAEMIGTLRSTSEHARKEALAGIERVATNVAAAHLCEANVSIRQGYPVTVNDAQFVEFARAVASDLIGPKRYMNLRVPLMGAEDFSYVLQRTQGCLMFLGVWPDGHDQGEHVAPCHSNRMVLNENSMAVGIAMHAAVATRFLEQGL
ncbi:MAG TPA: M20 family metallopeptidase [Candidatus Binataceae bacterium]|nr:M20 family metallopeptidase [Candidatus Binataceae bacterium]